MQEVAEFTIQGMNRDKAVAVFDSKNAYENMNMRIMSIDNNTLSSLVNEKGNKLESSIKGIPIGQAVINNTAVIFTTGSDKDLDIDITPVEEDIDNILTDGDTDITIDADFNDRIYKVWYEGDTINKELLFTGNLNFDYQHPIETIPYYENEDIQKVYWVDGKNQPRVINISNSEIISENSVDFVSNLKLQEYFYAVKKHNNGVFPSGVIQYAFTYYNKNLQETNVVYTTPLYYTSYIDRGGSPEEKTDCSFYIYLSYSEFVDTYSKLDTNYEYLRIYSILRTSIDSTPSVKRIADIKIADIQFEGTGMTKNALLVIDDGMIGETSDATELLYKGGEEVIASTFTQKNNTLFLGDLELKRGVIPTDLTAYFKSDEVKNSIKFRNRLHTYSTDKSLELDYSSEELKSFKYLEWYRFGIQFQHESGKWSNPIWITDLYNDVKINGSFLDDGVNLVEAVLKLNGDNLQSVLQKIVELGYIKVRPIVVFPSIQDRECVCQGVLCPTVYNVQYRMQNKPFVQSSWFVRPNAPYDCGSEDDSIIVSKDGIDYSQKYIMSNEVYYDSNYNVVDTVRKGTWNEFRHNYPIPGNNYRNGEIQCLYNVPSSPALENPEKDDYNDWLKQNNPCYFIDQSIVTMHSPDIEFDTNIQNLNTGDLKLRIVGVVPITSTKTGASIQVETSQLTINETVDGVKKLTPGYYWENVGISTTTVSTSIWKIDPLSYFGWRGLVSGIFWLDEIVGMRHVYKVLDGWQYLGYAVYPWHRTGSLNNDVSWHDDGDNHTRSAKLKHKVMSNCRYSYNTQYLDTDRLWLAELPDSDNSTGISDVRVINTEEDTIFMLKEPLNSNLGTIYYKGNVDQLVSPMDIYTLTLKAGDDGRLYTANKLGYPIMVTNDYSWYSNSAQYANARGLGITDIFIQPYDMLSKFALRNDEPHSEGDYYSSSKYSYDTDPISIKYKSTQHAVITLNYTKDHKQVVLPTFTIDGYHVNSANGLIGDSFRWFWQKEDTNPYAAGVYQQGIDTGINSTTKGGIGYGFLWLGELYRDTVENRFGGNTEEALNANTWVPCGEGVLLIDNTKGVVKSSIELVFTEGDTYYQRYDHLKTYPYTNEDYNSIVDAVSFMCETRVNLLGRYDLYQDDFDFLSMTPELKTKYNQVNEVYSQTNNYFSYRQESDSVETLDKFRNTVTWTKTKTAGEDVDQWTNITLASTLDLDGNKGYIRALRKQNDSIIAFQDRAISQILYNEQTQISTESGVPIEIANSGKVQGYRTLFDNIGCINKWSICSIPAGIVFTDDINKDIYLYSGQAPANITDGLGFHAWMGLHSSIDIWNPVDFSNMVTYYDTVTDDVYFITKEIALAYNVSLNSFTSFYTYGKTPYMISLPHKTIALYSDNDRDYNIWLQQAGDYNSYYGKFNPFYTIVIANPKKEADKVFDNIFFTSDSWDSNNTLLESTFDTLTTWNEYQRGESKLVNIKDKPSTLKKKFRMWRANIPRDSVHTRDRMRNPWLYIRLAREDENYDRTVLNTLQVQYFI